MLELFRHRARRTARPFACGGERAPNAGRQLRQPTLFTDADSQHAHRPGGDLRAGADGDPVRRTRPRRFAIANDIRYGLAAYIWTRDVGRAHRFAQRVEAGMVWVNSENVRHLPTPFGGMKATGIGRDGGDYSFDFYMETKNICVALDTHKVPRIGA